MRHLILFCIILLYPFFSFGQQLKIDSLKIEFNKAKQDTLKAKILSEIGIAAYRINIDVAKKHNDTLIAFSKEKSERYLAQGYRMRGVFCFLEGDYTNAETWYLKALRIAEKNNYTKPKAGYLANLGGLHGRQNNIEKAVEYYLQSIEINKSIENYTNIIKVYSNLSIVLSSDNRILESTEYLIEALEIAEKHLPSKLYFIHKDLGANYMALLQFEKAHFHLLKALELLNKEDLFLAGVIHEKLASLYDSYFDDYEKALYHAEESLQFYTRINSVANIIETNYLIGQQKFQLKRKNDVKNHYLKGLELATKTKDTFFMITGNYLLAELFATKGKVTLADNHFKISEELLGNSSRIKYKQNYYRLGNAYARGKSYKQAFDNMKSFAVLSDSLYKKNGVDKVIEIETKYQTEKKEKENLQLKADKIEQEQLTERANTQNILFAIGLLASLLTLGVFVYFYRRSKKQKTIIENLQKELHHRVKNNLSIIDTFIEVSKEEFSDAKFETKLTELQNRIDSINEVHQQLYLSNDITRLNLKNYIDTLSHNIQNSFPDSNIQLKNTINDDLGINTDKSFSVGLIVNEFLTNSYKYAFDDANGEIHIDMTENKQGYELSLSDNGKGLPQGFDIKKTESFGMRIMKLLTEQLNGSFKLSNSNGVILHITFPKS